MILDGPIDSYDIYIDGDINEKRYRLLLMTTNRTMFSVIMITIIIIIIIITVWQ